MDKSSKFYLPIILALVGILAALFPDKLPNISTLWRIGFFIAAILMVVLQPLISKLVGWSKSRLPGHAYAFVTSAWFRLLLILVIVSILLLSNQSIQNVILISVLALLAMAKPEFRLLKNQTINRLEDLSKWHTITGTPKIDDRFGNPKPPGLLLEKYSGSPTNTLLFVKDVNMSAGVVELDYYLEPEGIVNILVLADKDNHNWYMARFDSRDGEHDNILLNEGGPGAHWRPVSSVQKGNSSKRRWHKARVEFSIETIRMFRDGALIAAINDPQLFGEYIGMFNEVNDAHLDNITIIKK
jgi:hypothetical protein